MKTLLPRLKLNARRSRLWPKRLHARRMLRLAAIWRAGRERRLALVMHDRPLTERDQRLHDAADRAADDLLIALLYGGASLGTIESRGGNGCGADITITKHTWAPGLWVNAMGHDFDLFDERFDTKLNEVPLRIVRADLAERRVYVTGIYRDIERLNPGTLLAPHHKSLISAETKRMWEENSFATKSHTVGDIESGHLTFDALVEGAKRALEHPYGNPHAAGIATDMMLASMNRSNDWFAEMVGLERVGDAYVPKVPGE